MGCNPEANDPPIGLITRQVLDQPGCSSYSYQQDSGHCGVKGATVPNSLKPKPFTHLGYHIMGSVTRRFIDR
jgi:hypothetical protein